MKNIIHIENLAFEYLSQEEESEVLRALDGVSLDIGEGSFTAILGRNGSGKSTLAKQLNALLTPLEGDVIVCGMNTRQEELVWEIRRNAGMVFQNPDNQLISAVVEDDVAFGPENLGIAPEEIRQRIDDAMKRTDIYHLRKKPPHMLSGGQKQRVAIAGTVAMRPKCIIFDEPTAMLDPRGRSEVMKIIKSLRDDGITVILITHFMEEAAEADRVIIMECGQIVMDGTPESVFSDADRLRKLGMELPPAADICMRLRKKGLQIPGDVLTADSLVSFLADRAPEKTKTGREADFGPEAKRGDDSGMAETGEAEPHDESDMILKAEHVDYVYSKGQPEETYALRDVSFSVKRGDFTGIIGHTGSGKSTLIQHLNGLLKPAAGKITVDGYEITSGNVPMREVRRKAGLVFQYPEYQLFEETVAKDVAYGPGNMGLSEEEKEQRVREAMALTGLPYDEFAGRSPFDLSGGQKRRAAIAGILAMRPEILILDEPTAGLDPQTHREILDMICRIRESTGTTVILVTHNMDDAARLCDKILVMDQGTLVLSGTPEEVFSQPGMLKQIGLGLPSGAEFVWSLRQRGIDVGTGILSAEEAADAVEQYFRRQERQEDERC